MLETSGRFHSEIHTVFISWLSPFLYFWPVAQHFAAAPPEWFLRTKIIHLCSVTLWFLASQTRAGFVHEGEFNYWSMIKHSIPVWYIAFLPSVYCCLLYSQFSSAMRGNSFSKKISHVTSINVFLIKFHGLLILSIIYTMVLSFIIQNRLQIEMHTDIRPLGTANCYFSS